MRWPAVAASIAALLAAGCGTDTSGPRPIRTLADMAGTWTLTSWEAVGVADTTQRLDLKARLTAIATLQVAADGGATFTSSVYGQSPTVQQATISLSGDTLSYHEITGDSRFLLSGTVNRMIWRGLIPQYQDVTGDGVPDETRTRMEFVRD
jgi:hypothetical protein